MNKEIKAYRIVFFDKFEQIGEIVVAAATRYLALNMLIDNTERTPAETNKIIKIINKSYEMRIEEYM